MAATARSLKLGKSRSAQVTLQNLIYLKDKEERGEDRRELTEGKEWRHWMLLCLYNIDYILSLTITDIYQLTDWLNQY